MVTLDFGLFICLDAWGCLNSQHNKKKNRRRHPADLFVGASKYRVLHNP